VRWAAGGVVKVEGRAGLARRLEDPIFRKDFIANPTLPAGRDIWNDNERLEIRLPDDPLTLCWPPGKNFESYDPVLKRTWEDEMFTLKWFGKARGQIQGGDWANYRKSTEVPPRIKIYYANIVELYQSGSLIGATQVFNALLQDFLAPRGEIPYGVYHTMLVIYQSRERYQLAYQMFKEIVSYHTPTADDYALGMEALLALNSPREALEVWESFQLRPSLKVNANLYSQLLRVYNELGELAQLEGTFQHAEQVSRQPNSAVDFLPIFTTMIDIYTELGFKQELLKLVEPIQSDYPMPTILAALEALNDLDLPELVIKNYSHWLPRKEGVGISFYNTLIQAHCSLGDIKGLESLLEDIYARSIPLDANSYAPIIAYQHKLGQSSLVSQLVNDGMSLKDIRPSVRNFRTVMISHIEANSAEVGVIQAALEDMNSKHIEQNDADLFEVVELAYLHHGLLQESLQHWQDVVLTQKMIPSRQAFAHFFKLAAKTRDVAHVANVWRLSELMRIKPDFEFASALALALQPDRNYFGLQEARRQHKRWTDESSTNGRGSRVLNKVESKQFTQFIEHVISTFNEAERKNLESLWKKTRAQLLEPTVEVPADVGLPVSRPVVIDTHPKFRGGGRFGTNASSKTPIPEPGRGRSDNDQAAASIAAAVQTESVVVIDEEKKSIEDVV
jgi:pentatricopeptide repeat protein